MSPDVVGMVCHADRVRVGPGGRRPRTTARIAGVVDIWEEGNKHIIQVTPTEGKTEKIALEDRTAQVKTGSYVKAGDVLAKAQDDKKPLVAPFDGEIEVTKTDIIIKANADRKSVV